MAMLKITFLGLMALSLTSRSQAQKNDTLIITGKHINTRVLKPGVHRYLVYFNMDSASPRSNTQFWTREISFGNTDGRQTLTVKQVWEDKDSIMHTTTSVCDANTFAPLYHESWWRRNKSTTQSVYDYVKRTAFVDGKDVSGDTSKRNRAAYEGFMKAVDQYNLNWHLDLEVFPTLPFALNKTFAVPYYDAGFSEPKPVYYTVVGKADLQGYDNKPVPCWLLKHESPGNEELFWISQKTREVLKLEQTVNKKIRRYKIKLAFSV
jgi:hypothetical protein